MADLAALAAMAGYKWRNPSPVGALGLGSVTWGSGGTSAVYCNAASALKPE